MYKSFLIGMLLYISLFIIRILFFTCISIYNKEKLNSLIHFNYKEVIIEAFIFTALLGTILWVVTAYIETEIVIIVLSMLLIALIPSYNYIIAPMLYLFSRPKHYKSKKVYNFLKKEKLNYNVRILKGNVTNAYATGVLPFSKTILIGENLINDIDDSQLNGIVLHEVGHLKKNHLSKLYIINLILSSLIYPLFYIKQHHTIPLYDSKIVEGLEIFFLGLLIGLLIWYIPSKIQYYFELEADLFAAKRIGVTQYISSLNNLDNLSNGKVSKGGITHPTLIKRINNIKLKTHEI